VMISFLKISPGRFPEISPIFDICRPISLKCRTCLVIHVQNELLNLLEPLFSRSTMKILY
jgi:hypothetical protein